MSNIDKGWKREIEKEKLEGPERERGRQIIRQRDKFKK